MKGSRVYEIIKDPDIPDTYWLIHQGKLFYLEERNTKTAEGLCTNGCICRVSSVLSGRVLNNGELFVCKDWGSDYNKDRAFLWFENLMKQELGKAR